MNKKERVDAALRGDMVDRVPASMWGHDFEREWNPNTLAEAMVENFTRYDWDYMKVNPRASYHVEGWGVKVRPSGEKYKAPIFEDTPIKSSSDWRRIRPLEADEGVLGEQLRALQMINHSIGYDAYFVQTIFCLANSTTWNSWMLSRAGANSTSCTTAALTSTLICCRLTRCKPSVGPRPWRAILTLARGKNALGKL